MIRLTLYTTLGCHLCEQARDVIDQSRYADRVEVEMMEIADSDDLTERYGIRIPVVRLSGTEQELGWPFNAAQFDQWLAGACPGRAL